MFCLNFKLSLNLSQTKKDDDEILVKVPSEIKGPEPEESKGKFKYTIQYFVDATQEPLLQIVLIQTPPRVNDNHNIPNRIYFSNLVIYSLTLKNISRTIPNSQFHSQEFRQAPNGDLARNNGC